MNWLKRLFSGESPNGAEPTHSNGAATDGEERDPLLAALERQIAIVRHRRRLIEAARRQGRRPSYDDLYPQPYQDEALDDLWGAPPWRREERRNGD